MKDYKKPVVIPGEDLFEGVYASSGCYAPRAVIHQCPETGRGDYRIQVDARHDATHTCDEQYLTLIFNMEVRYVSSNGSVIGSGIGTSVQIKYNYWQNQLDTIGLGDVVVEADVGLAVLGVRLTDNG